MKHHSIIERAHIMFGFEKKPLLSLKKMKQDVDQMVQDIEKLYDESILRFPRQTVESHDISKDVRPFLKNEKTLVKGLMQCHQKLIQEKKYAQARSTLLLDSDAKARRVLKEITLHPTDTAIQPLNTQEVSDEEDRSRSALLRNLNMAPRHNDRNFYSDDELEHQEAWALIRFFIELKKFRFLEARLNKLKLSKHPEVRHHRRSRWLDE